jgi:hypothetical protein
MRTPRCVLLLACGVIASCDRSDESFSPENTSETGAAVTAKYNWLQFNGDEAHSGNDTQEVSISPGSVPHLQALFSVHLPSTADGAPAVVTGVVTQGEIVRDLLFLTTKGGDIIALDAHTCEQVWAKHNGPGSCHINNGAGGCYTTSSPAVEPTRQFVFSYGLDGFVHKYKVADGAEVTGGGWPELATVKSFNEKGSSALSIATDTKTGVTYLYATNGGYPGDRGDYQGHVTAIDLATGSQRVFNTVCSNQTVHLGLGACADVQSAVWARVGVVHDTATNRILLVTGAPGTYAPTSHAWADSVLALNPDGTGASAGPLDSYTPTDFAALSHNDADLGSTAPAILPVPASSRVQHLGAQSGKDGLIRLINLDNLSGRGAPGYTGGEVAVTSVPQGSEVNRALAVWVNPADKSTWVFVANDEGISGLRLEVDGSGNPSLVSQWKEGPYAGSPIVANGVLFCAGGNRLRALNPASGAVLWTSPPIGGTHWESPVVANGIVYIADESGNLSAFTSGSRDVTPPSTPTNLSASAVSSSQIDLSWTASTDNVGVAGYTVFRDGMEIATSAINSYKNTGLAASTTYKYAVSAYDAAGDNSALSASASATTKASGLEYVGCYTDKSTRALPTVLASSSATVESCVAAAKAKSLAYAGLQYGGQCFGGSTLGYTLVSNSQCDMPCTAKPTEICGGVWRNSIYATR